MTAKMNSNQDLIQHIKPLFFQKGSMYRSLINVQDNLNIQEELWRIYCGMIEDGEIDIFNGEISTFFDSVLWCCALGIDVLVTSDERMKKLQELAVVHQLLFEIHQYLPIPEYEQERIIHLGPSGIGINYYMKSICGKELPDCYGESMLLEYPTQESFYRLSYSNEKVYYCTRCLDILYKHGQLRRKRLVFPCEILIKSTR